MILDTPIDTNQHELKTGIEQAQATAVAERIGSTLMFNFGIAGSAVLISAFNHGFTLPIFIWLAIVLLTLIVRFASTLSMQRRKLIVEAPHRALKILWIGSLCSGLAWATLPYFIPAFDGLGPDAAIYVIMVGVCAGAIVKGVGYSRAATAFALPPQISVVLLLMANHDITGFLLAMDVTGLMLVFYQSSLTSEATFVSNVSATLKATALAQSLSRANADIMQQNQQLEILANSDSLTGLANRSLFNTHLRDGVATAATNRQPLALLLIDLDRFKSINDTLGHTVGDAVLIEMSRRLRHIVGSAGNIARLGGDEFAVIFTGEDAAGHARVQADEILRRCREPVTMVGQALSVGVSIGVAAYPAHAETAEDLLACADMALYAAKENGRRQVQSFDPSLKALADRQRLIERDLEEAIRSGEVEPWFQPQVRLDTDCISGFEALVRWNHPTLGAIAPPEIVQAAHTLHISDQLTAQMAEAACRLLVRLPALGLPTATVAVNVSPREFATYSVADMLEDVTSRHDIEPSLLEIEITEEAILDTEVAEEQLTRLEQAGYKLAVDDFGMGHSSLAYLVDLKIDRLKIDRSFATGVATSRRNQDLISALVGLGASLSIDVVVEGVETLDDAVALEKLGCRIGQGYYFARPMAVGPLIMWIDARKPPAPRRAVA
jgi:diguanylate cyclase (GGDEF)-like protein